MPDDVFGDGYDPSTMGDAGGSDPFGGATGGAGGGGASGLQKLLTGLKGNAKPFMLGALLGSTQGLKGAMMAPVLTAMMGKKGARAPIPGQTSTGAPDMAGPAGLPKMLQEARASGVPGGGAGSQGTGSEAEEPYKKGGSVRRKAIGGMALPAPLPGGMAMQRPMMGGRPGMGPGMMRPGMAPPPGMQRPMGPVPGGAPPPPAPAPMPTPTPTAAPPPQGMPMQTPAPAATMRKGGSTNKKAFGGLMSNKFKMQSKMKPMVGVGIAVEKKGGDKMPLSHHNYPKSRKPEMELKKGGSTTMTKKCAEGGTPAADKPGFKELLASGKAKKDERDAPAMKKYMGGPIRQKHEMAMGKSAPTKQEPPKGTAERRATGGSVRGWGAARSTGGCTIT